MLGELNIKSKNWYNNDKTTTEGAKIESVISRFGLHQIINESIHVLQSSSPCIDLTFTSQPNLVVGSGVQPSLHPKSHHQNLTSKSISSHPTNEKYDITGKGILNLFEEHFMNLIGRGHLVTEI